MSITTDQHFTDAFEAVCETIPANIKEEISRLTEITQLDIDTSISNADLARFEMQKKLGTSAKHGLPLSEEQARNRLASSRGHEIDWIFFRNWRLADGWLNSDQIGGTLDIFHDLLAKEMSRRTVSNLFPNAQISNE